MHAPFDILVLVVEFVWRQLGVMRFLCVASAAHFLFYGIIFRYKRQDGRLSDRLIKGKKNNKSFYCNYYTIKFKKCKKNHTLVKWRKSGRNPPV